jgi:hypothetical protein
MQVSNINFIKIRYCRADHTERYDKFKRPVRLVFNDVYVLIFETQKMFSQYKFQNDN